MQYQPQGAGSYQGGAPQEQPPPAQQGGGLPEYVWMFEVKPGVWQPVAPHDNETIEKAFKESGSGSAHVDLYGPNSQPVTYKVDFPRMSRVNVATGSDRKMRRVTGQELISLPPNTVIPPPTAAPPSTSEVPVEVQWILGSEDPQNMPPLPLQPEDSQKVEAAYKAGQPSIALTLGELGQFTLDVRNFTRTGPDGKTGEIVRIDPSSLPPITPAPKGLQWFFQDDRKCWVAFAGDDSEAIEAKYQAGPMGNLDMRGITYELSFHTWTRKNTATGSTRPIRRVNDGKEDPKV